VKTLLSRSRFLLGAFLSILLYASLMFSVKADTSTWVQTYGGAGSDVAYSVVETSDGGYALAGFTSSFGAGGYDAWLVKTNAGGDAEWNMTYGGASNDVAYSLVVASDGGYALAGSTGSFGAGGMDFWLVKTNADGNMKWNRTYGGGGTDSVRALVETSDGGYALAGTTDSFGAGLEDFWLVKTDSAGNMEWNRTYGGVYNDVTYSLVALSDGGVALAGLTDSFTIGSGDCLLVKIDAAGNTEWSQIYKVGAYDLFKVAYDGACSLVATSDGGYALAGYLEILLWSEQGWLVKTDALGNMEWNQTFSGLPGYNEVSSLVEASDGGYTIVGEGHADFLLIKTNASGIEWEQPFGGSESECAYSVVEASDGGYAVAGYTESFGVGGMDALLIKTDEYGVVPEFHSWLIPSLLLAAVSVIVINRKRLFHQNSRV
jgi:predicted secreted protein